MVACNPIEDKSLRDDYITNAGTPVTSEELTSYLHVDQPYPNTDTAVEGDQIVSLKNDRPEIGGVWHVVTSMGETILKSDSCTYTYESNGEFEVYYVALSAGKIVESAHFPITVTNVFDPWAGYLTGAKDKADRARKRLGPGERSHGALSATWERMVAGSMLPPAILPSPTSAGGAMSR